LPWGPVLLLRASFEKPLTDSFRPVMKKRFLLNEKRKKFSLRSPLLVEVMFELLVGISD
jgi:CheY-specific phosphatase CheX